MFCVTDVAKLRETFSHKFCFKKKHYFLKLKQSPSTALAGRLTKKGNFLKTYKLLKRFYYNYMLTKLFKKIPLTSNFLFFYNKYVSFRDLDRVLMWKYKALDCMFSHKSKTLRKKKQQLTKIIFISGKKKIILCMNFIKCLILLNCKRKKKKMNYKLFLPLFDYLTNDKTSLVLKIKYKIYRQKLIQMQA